VLGPAIGIIQATRYTDFAVHGVEGRPDLQAKWQNDSLSWRIGGDNTLIVSDAKTGQELTRLPMEDGNDSRTMVVKDAKGQVIGQVRTFVEGDRATTKAYLSSEALQTIDQRRQTLQGNGSEHSEGEAYEIRNQKEADLVASMRGKSPRDIQAALDDLRAGEGSGADSGEASKLYSGKLIPTNDDDPAAKALAAKIGGQASVHFENDPKKREFDAVSKDYIAETKAGGIQNPGKSDREQMKAIFEAAKATGRRPYFEFTGQAPSPRTLDHIRRYEERYGLTAVIDQPLQANLKE
jgi:hypothetical protein